jgi:hypothetical protein
MPEPVKVQSIVLKTLYVHIDDPEDHDALLALKKACSKHPGQSEVVMVLGKNKGSAIRLPFRVDIDRSLTIELQSLLGEDRVVLK